MGTPSPHVTLYLNGHPLRTEVTRHMVTNIHNVTRDMEHVSCYADNGYGTPMIASRKITIARAPSVTETKVEPTTGPALTGETAVIMCKVRDDDECDEMTYICDEMTVTDYPRLMAGRRPTWPSTPTPS